MAIMKRGQKAAAQGWGAIAKQREDTNQDKDMEVKEVSPEEEKRRIEALIKLGIIGKD